MLPFEQKYPGICPYFLLEIRHENLIDLKKMLFFTGRNLAFKESASQSSTYKNWHAHQAVSGGYLNIPTDYLTESTHCIHTRKGLGSWWMVTLRADVMVSLFKILNRRDRNYKSKSRSSLKLPVS